MAAVAYQKPANTHQEQATGHQYQVLVVDDDPVNRDVASNYLSMSGISFKTVSDGIEALKLIESGEKPHLILLDIMMPRMNGYDVCRKLRDTHSHSELPIIMLTAKNRVTDLVEGYEAGANDYLAKPFSKDELAVRITCQLELREAYHTFMENQRLEREIEQQIQKKERAQLREEKEKLEKLRYQLNPHFLFNALASVRGAILKDQDVAHKMVSHLSEFTRLALSRANMEILSVDNELEVIRHYLAMEQMRYGDYMNVSIKIDPNVESMNIPAFILHPIVENTVKYGSLTSPDKLDIEIDVNLPAPEILSINISNTGTWVTPGTADKKISTGIGIKNIRQRLEQYYGANFKFETHNKEGLVSVLVEIPGNIPGKN